MKRILHIIGKMDRAGAETMLMNLYRHIDRSKIQFDFITFTTDKGDYDDEIIAMGGNIIPIIAKDSVGRMFKLQKFLKAHPEYQVIHSHVLLNNAFHLIAAKSAGIKHRISHSHNTSNGRNSNLKKLYEIWAKKTIQQLATYRIACGVEAAQYLYGTADDVLILNNAIDLKKYADVATTQKSYWCNVLPHKGLRLIQVGRLTEVKNYEFSLKIAKALREQGFEFTFFIVGQGGLESKIRDLIIEYELSEQVHLLGVRDDVPELMAGADLMLMPSFHEGFPVVLVESQAIGLPSLISINISREVDLGIDLIEYENLNKMHNWLNKIKGFNLSLKPQVGYIDLLAKQGFDIKKNSEKLLNLYIDMESK
ncbi:hypothetical protein AFK20_10735 [Enhydrobacter aerosaccus]|uniref:Uncharacterized protein n=1 Tax=Enhydrobacter aerosaccus TaxID=225324 RepID=A0ABR5IJP7_9HYPH|nr:glycosyltransferase [Enhydrobacter aerosaccus]KND19541.1 hypothetical protein AFK20_10735 [Enhydrobacter aerosaccus]